MPYWMQRKQSSFWGLSFKPALALQLVPSQQLLKVTASSHRGVTQTFFRLFSLPRKLPAWSLLKQLGKFSPPGITQMLRNWQLLQEKKSAFWNKIWMKSIFYLRKSTSFCFVWQFFKILIILEILSDDLFCSVKVRWNSSRRNHSISS